MDQKQKNRKKLLKVLLGFGGLLLILLVGALIYFYTIGEINETEQPTTNIACGCYMIDPNVINECGDPKRAFLFNINKVSSNEVCNAQCDTNQISENLLNSSTPKDSYKVCIVRSISDTRCENMILKDSEGQIITGKIPYTDEINVEATFDSSEYTDYIFKVNSDTVQPDSLDGNKITKSITDLGTTDSIEIVATASDSQGDSINSIICRRVVDITRSGDADVNNLSITTDTQSSGLTRISQITITAGQVTGDDVKVRFSFSDTSISPIVASDGLSISSSKGTISMSKVDAYNSANFESSQNFSVLDSYVGDITVTAQVLVDGASIGTASTEITFVEPTQEQPDEQPATDEDETEGSQFTAQKSVTPTCVERTEGSNEATFTLTVTNGNTVADTITSIKDKLPLGFVYTEGSTTVDGIPTADTPLVTVTSVGDTQEVVWEPPTPWSIASGSTLAITFDSTAGSSALSGENLNEVLVNPTEIPENPDSLRADVSIIVAQDCDNITPDEETPVPSTGIFDNTVVRIILGALIIGTGWFVYARPEGTALSKLIVGSGIYKDSEMFKYKVTNPRKYFEEKTLRNDPRENQGKKK